MSLLHLKYFATRCANALHFVSLPLSCFLTLRLEGFVKSYFRIKFCKNVYGFPKWNAKIVSKCLAVLCYCIIIFMTFGHNIIIFWHLCTCKILVYQGHWDAKETKKKSNIHKNHHYVIKYGC